MKMSKFTTKHGDTYELQGDYCLFNGTHRVPKEVYFAKKKETFAPVVRKKWFLSKPQEIKCMGSVFNAVLATTEQTPDSTEVTELKPGDVVFSVEETQKLLETLNFYCNDELWVGGPDLGHHSREFIKIMLEKK
jgi:hypothetical protein